MKKLKRIVDAINIHNADFKKKGERDYGSVGDIGHVAEVLSELDSFVEINR